MSINYYSLEMDQTYTIRGTVKLLNVASAKYSGDWQCAVHTHAYMELFYIIGGTGMFLIGNQEHPVHVNDIIMINPDVSHAEVSINGQTLEYIVLGIEGIQAFQQTILHPGSSREHGNIQLPVEYSAGNGAKTDGV